MAIRNWPTRLLPVNPDFDCASFSDGMSYHNKFCDCAIAAEANYVVTEDNDFNALKSAGYKPKPIRPEEFIRQYLEP